LPNKEPLALSPAERAMMERIATRDGVSIDEAATRLVQAALARRVRRRTGKGPARVYSIGENR